jgi:hypothetical protein
MMYYISAMSLISKQLADALPRIGHYANSEESTIVITAKFFLLTRAATWLVAEFDPRTGVMFCYVDLYGDGKFAEWGYTYVQELESLYWLGIPAVERDMYFSPTPFLDCVDKEGRIIV